MKKRDKKFRNIFWGLAIALGILTLGFGIMFVLYYTIDYPRNLPGLFFYKTAIWGDSICLPVLLFCLVVFILSNQIKEYNKKINNVVVVAAVVIAIVIQAEWILSEKTKLNWTIPQKHYFNLAGWYHSLFFVLMFGVIAHLVFRVITIIKNHADNYKRTEQILFCGMIASGSGFILLFLLDDYSKKISINYLFPLFLLLLVAIILSVLKCTKIKDRRKLSIATLYGVLLSFSGIVPIVINKRGNVFLAFGVMVCGCIVIWKNKKQIRKSIETLCISVPYFIITYYASGIDDYREKISILIFLLIISICIERELYKKISFLTIPMALIFGYMILESLNNNKIVRPLVREISTVDILFYIVSSVLFEGIITKIFNKDVIEKEQERNKGNIDEKVFKQGKKAAYFKIIIILLGVISLLWCWGMSVVRNIGGKNIDIGDFSYGNHLFTVLILCLILFMISKLKIKKLYREMLVAILTISIYAVLISNVILIIQNNSIKLQNISLSQSFLFIIVAFALFGAPIFVAYGFKMNLNDLRNRSEKIALLLSTVLLVGGCLLNLANAIILVSKLTLSNICLVFINTAVMFEILPLCCTFGLKMENADENRAQDEPHVILNQPFEGVMQDGFSAMLIQMFCVGVPCIYIGSLNTSTLDVWISLGGIMIPGMIVVEFFLRNNVGHVERQRQVVERQPNEMEIWETLAKCLRTQNIIAIIATLPFCLCKIILNTLRLILRGKVNGINELIKYLITTYISYDKKANKN